MVGEPSGGANFMVAPSLEVLSVDTEMGEAFSCIAENWRARYHHFRVSQITHWPCAFLPPTPSFVPYFSLVCCSVQSLVSVDAFISICVLPTVRAWFPDRQDIMGGEPCEGANFVVAPSLEVWSVGWDVE